MQKVIFILLVLHFSMGYSQKNDFNFIVSVNDNLENVYAYRFVLKNKNGKKDVVNLNYIPGKISIEKSDYQALLSDSIIQINLIVRSLKQCGNRVDTSEYKIENFKLAWLNKGSYFILYIYDTNNKKYNKIYEPLPNEHFTFEFDWSEGSMRRVQKKQLKGKCN